MSFFCPICFNSASNVWSSWIQSLRILSFFRYHSSVYFLFSSLCHWPEYTRYQPALIFHKQCLQQQWSHLTPLFNSNQPWHHHAISITTHDIIIVAQRFSFKPCIAEKRNWLRSLRWSWQNSLPCLADEIRTSIRISSFTLHWKDVWYSWLISQQ